MRQSIDKIATFVLRFIPAFLAIAIPLFFLTTTPDYFSFNKQYLLFAVASISLTAYIFRVLARGKIHLTLSPSLLPVILLIIAYVVPSIWMHQNPRAALFGPTAMIISLAIIFITTTSTQKNSQLINSTIIGLIFSATILSIVAILQNFGLLANIFSYEILKNPFFTLSGNPFYSLTFIIPITIATLTYTFYSRNWVIKPILFSLSIIMLIGIFLSAKLLLPQNGNPGLAILPLSTGWSIAVDSFKLPKTAIFGYGPDNFANAFSRLKPASLNLNKDFWSIRFNNSTTEALTVLTITGILGLLSFATFLLNPISVIIKKIKDYSDPETVFISALAIISALLFFVLPNNVLNYTLLFVSTILLTVKLKLSNNKKIKDVHVGITANELESGGLYSDISSSTKQIQLPVLPWILTGMSAVLLAVFWTGSINIYKAANAISVAGKNIKDNPQLSYEKQLEAAKLDPYNPYYKINLSQTYLAIANNLLSKEDATDEQKKQAIDYANLAINESKGAAELDPQNVQVWENFANIARQLAVLNVQGSIDWTLATYGQAISVDPTNPSLRVQLGTFYYLLGDYDTAAKILDQALELKPDWNVSYFNQSEVYKAKKDYTRALAFMKEGLKYTDQNSEDIAKINEEIKALEKLAPAPAATNSGQPK